MQRRLTLAIVGVALAAIVLVGLGVLGFAQIGATSRARSSVEARLAAIEQLVDTDAPFDRRGPAIAQLGESFGSGTTQLGILTERGEIRIGGRRGDPGADLRIELEADRARQVAEGETVVYRTDGRMRGIQPLQLTERGRIVAVVEQPIARLGSETRVWFAVSAAIVVAGAAVVSALLARRLAEPVREAGATVSAISRGDLGARMSPGGDAEFAELAENINHMASELERGRAAEQQFLLSVSHDLRTPLTAIAGYAEALRDGATDDPARAGAIIGNHADRLDRLVRDLLDLAKLDSRQFRFESGPVDSSAVVARVVEGLRPQAEGAGLEIRMRTAGQAPIQADPDRLGQVVANLVDNASKFADATVEVVVDTEPADHVTISVSDDGPGIEAEDLPHVFERLYVTQARPRRAESSTGLGLAIVRELTTAMGGSVRVESGSGSLGGATFTLQFPLLPSA